MTGRIVKTAETFQTKIAVCINKLGQIPFDPLAVEAINNGQTIVDIECLAGEATRTVFARTLDLLLMDSLNTTDAD